MPVLFRISSRGRGRTIVACRPGTNSIHSSSHCRCRPCSPAMSALTAEKTLQKKLCGRHLKKTSPDQRDRNCLPSPRIVRARNSPCQERSRAPGSRFSCDASCGLPNQRTIRSQRNIRSQTLVRNSARQAQTESYRTVLAVNHCSDIPGRTFRQSAWGKSARVSRKEQRNSLISLFRPQFLKSTSFLPTMKNFCPSCQSWDESA